MKLATLNIYGGAHTAEATKQLAQKGLETLCLQELHEADIEGIKTSLGLPHACFCPMWDVQGENPYGFRPGKMGVAILTKYPATFAVEHYVGEAQNVPIFDTQKPNGSARALVSAEITHPTEGRLLVATTHFTWTPDGKSSPEQEKDVERLIKLLRQKENLIFCGDLNAPRGGDIFLRFSNLLVDQMPKEIETTIDQNLHRKPGLRLVVDAILTSPDLVSKTFEGVDGVSDHIALVTQIKKKPKAPKHEHPWEMGM